MWFLTVFPVLLLAIHLPNIKSEWHGDAGPWVIATEGEVWPRPARNWTFDEFYLLRYSNFQILYDGYCDITLRAIHRYTHIIFAHTRSARKVNKNKPKKNFSNDPAFKGFIKTLNIEGPTSDCKDLLPTLYADEHYVLNINRTGDEATLSSETTWGILRGLETFSQLLTPSGSGAYLKIRRQVIIDGPRLPHRGLLLDTSRHYLPLADIRLTLDAMSYNKLNVLHWHIVDDNSFPYQSETYPNLSKEGAYHSSMVYSIANINDIIQYARLRGIWVIPEFDTPGHTRSWGNAYPELLTTCYNSTGQPNGRLGPIDPTKDSVYSFISTLFTEVVQVFPGSYLHLGGDEVPFSCWASNPDIIKYMDSQKLGRNFAKLEEQYIHKVLDIVSALNTTAIVWQEVFDNGVSLPNSTIVHVWTGSWKTELSKITAAGHPVLLSACWYLDHTAEGGDWKKFYVCDPMDFPGFNTSRLMLGGEACMWGEFVDKNNIHPRIWPRASAAAERLWSEFADDLDTAARRLEEHACRMNRRGIPAQPPNGSGFCVV
ncbi:beta-hexosaminidase subunit alpha [Cephus cinctus]|uniref:Beta-hexosaminidase n=1 Tax=Cephus cinctus TaxID=211228 RepID=A0AAJ7FIP2_CEPCN|nr:beta-hexosaminidase subunit alpha [Cephus cinctus]